METQSITVEVSCSYGKQDVEKRGEPEKRTHSPGQALVIYLFQPRFSFEHRTFERISLKLQYSASDHPNDHAHLMQNMISPSERINKIFVVSEALKNESPKSSLRIKAES